MKHKAFLANKLHYGILYKDHAADLNIRERHVLERYYGWGQERTTYEELGRELNVSRERVRQIRLTAEGKLGHARERPTLAFIPLTHNPVKLRCLSHVLNSALELPKNKNNS